MKNLIKVILAIVLLTLQGCVTRHYPTQEEARATWESESKCLYDFEAHTWDYRTIK